MSNLAFIETTDVSETSSSSIRGASRWCSPSLITERQILSKTPVRRWPRQTLLPIDITQCPLDVFEFVNSFARSTDATVTLLYVVNLSVLGGANHLYEGLGRDAQVY